MNIFQQFYIYPYYQVIARFNIVFEGKAILKKKSCFKKNLFDWKWLYLIEEIHFFWYIFGLSDDNPPYIF